MIAPARQVLLPDSAYSVGLEVALIAQSLDVEQRFCPVAQAAAQPAGHRHSEPVLRPLCQLSRHVACKDFAQYPLASRGVYAHLERQRPGQLDYAVIENRTAHLQTHRHARPVHLDQDAIGHEAGEVQVGKQLEGLQSTGQTIGIAERRRQRTGARHQVGGAPTVHAQ